MADLNITNFGSQYTTGNSINSVAIGEDGSVYLAGGTNATTAEASLDSANRNMDLAVFCYKDGVLQWKRVFGGDYKVEDFKQLVYKDGYVYASGGVGYDFRTDADGLSNSVWPSNKPYDPTLTGLEPGVEFTLATVFVKLDALTGATALDRVIDSSTAGNLGWSSIDVDASGNIYVTSDHKLSSYAADGTFKWGDLHSDYSVKVIDGMVFTQAGERITKINPNGETVFNYYPKSDDQDGLGIVDYVIDQNGDIIVALQKHDLSKGSWDDLWDLGLTPKKEDIAPGLITTQIRKISGVDGKFLWTTTLNEEGISIPSSITISADGKILVTGSTVGDLNGGDDSGENSFGSFDAYLVKLDSDGAISETQIIGTTDKPERASKGVYDAQQNLFLSGDFDSKYFDLKDSGFQNIYLISDVGFTLMGDESANQIQGGNGNDSISGGLGDDILGGGLGKDKLDGGVGFDVASYESSESAVTVNLQTNTASGSDIGVDSLINIEEARGGEAADQLTANKAGSKLVGGGGADKLNGGGGKDVLYGGDGDDAVNAGAGNDEIIGGDGAGNDNYIGGAGVDTIKYSSARSGITVNLSAIKDHAKSTGQNDVAGIGTDQLSQIENVIGGDYDDLITGNTLTNILDGGAGADTLVGDDGNDVYIVENSGDVVTEKNSAANQVDEVRATVSWTLGTNVENLILGGTAAINGTGNALNNLMTGNASDNILLGESGVDILLGANGNDTLDGGAGIDKLTGGLGDDTYIIDNAKDTITEKANEGTDGVQTILKSYSIAKLTAIENLIFAGSGNAVLTGNTIANTLAGSSGNDSLDGGAGNDSLIGGDGADQLIGGLGNDTLTGGTGLDKFRFGSALGATNVDSIADFQSGVDRIEIDDAIFKKFSKKLGPVAENNFKSGDAGVSAGDADDYLIYNTSTGDLFYDSDGNGAGVMMQFAKLVGVSELHHADILVF